MFVFATFFGVSGLEAPVLTGLDVTADWSWGLEVTSNWNWWGNLTFFTTRDSEAFILAISPWAIFMSVVFITIFTAWTIFWFDAFVSIEDKTVWTEASFTVHVNLAVLDSHIVAVFVLAGLLDAWSTRFMDLISGTS